MTRSFKLAMYCALILLAFALRVFGLQSDPPSLDVLPDQAPWTDEGTLSLQSVESIRGQSLTDRLVESGRPLHVLALSAVYQTLGVGRFQGRLVSVWVGLLGLIILARIAEQTLKYGGLLALVIAVTGFFFVIYGQLILTEGLVVAALCLVDWIGIRAESAGSAFAAGVLLCLVAVTLKLLALALLPGLALLYLLRRRRLLVPFLVGVGLVFLVWRLFWITGHESYVGYVQERLGGELLGIAPPEIIALQILLAGAPLDFLPYQLPLFLLASFEILACLLSPRRWLQESSDPILVAMLWLLATIVVVGLFRYTPPRYYHIASPALVLLSIAGARRLWLGQAFPRAPAIVRVICAAMLGIVLIGQFGPAIPLLGEGAFSVLLPGLFFPVVFLWLTSRSATGWGLTARTRMVMLVGLIAFQMLEQAWLYSAGILPARKDLPHAAAVLADQVPQSALIVGRLAGTLALLAPLQGYPIMDRIDLDPMIQLARTRSVWFVMLPEYEDDLDPRLRVSLVNSFVFPVNYSSKSRWFTVYQFDPQKGESQ